MVKEEMLRGTLVMYQDKHWSVVKFHNAQHVEIWRRGRKSVVPLKELKIIG